VKTVEYWLPDFDWFGVAAAFGFAGAQRECQQYGDEEYVAVGLCLN
jgi:transglutaminase-like putative cysteine protease